MSLTQLLLHNDEIKACFGTIPNLKNSFRSIDGSEPFPSNPQIIIKSDGRANPIVGTSYDYWFRSFVQRINGVHQEVSGDRLNASIAVKMLSLEFKGLKEAYEGIIGRRNRYITGICSLDDVIIRDSIMLGRLEHYYRSGEISDCGLLYVSEADNADLYRLAAATESNAHLFRASRNIICNPVFGDAITRLVDGADGDLIIDDMLIDIKCESVYKWQLKHQRQLIGYWILSCLTPSFNAEIKRLGLWNPRYQKLVHIEIKDICRAIDMLAFTDRFIDIISKPDFDESKGMNGEEVMHLGSIIKQIWNCEDQPLKKYYS